MKYIEENVKITGCGTKNTLRVTKEETYTEQITTVSMKGSIFPDADISVSIKGNPVTIKNLFGEDPVLKTELRMELTKVNNSLDNFDEDKKEPGPSDEPPSDDGAEPEEPSIMPEKDPGQKSKGGKKKKN